MSDHKSPCRDWVSDHRCCRSAISMLNRIIVLALSGATGTGASLLYSGEGNGTSGQARAGVDLDPMQGPRTQLASRENQPTGFQLGHILAPWVPKACQREQRAQKYYALLWERERKIRGTPEWALAPALVECASRA